MPRRTTGSIYRTANGYGIRWPENSQRPHQDGFRTKTDARRWFAENIAPRLDRGHAPSPDITFDAFCVEYLDRWGADVSARTRETVEEWLAPARDRFGTWKLRELEGAADDVSRWRATLPTDDRRYKCTRGLRQVLAAAQRWGYITRNPAVDIGANQAPRGEELQPFTRAELDAIVAELAPRDAAIVIFAAETGLGRTNGRRSSVAMSTGVTPRSRYSAGSPVARSRHIRRRRVVVCCSPRERSTRWSCCRRG